MFSWRNKENIMWIHHFFLELWLDTNEHLLHRHVTCTILMGESSQLTPLSTLCKQPDPIDSSAFIISISIKYHFFFIDKSNFDKVKCHYSFQNIKKKYFLCIEIYTINKFSMWICRNVKLKIG